VFVPEIKRSLIITRYIIIDYCTSLEKATRDISIDLCAIAHAICTLSDVGHDVVEIDGCTRLISHPQASVCVILGYALEPINIKAA